MPRYAELVPAAAAREAARAARPRRLAPPPRSTLWHVLQLRAAEAARAAPAPRTPSRSGLPEKLKAGLEALSGLAMGDVRVHRNSPAPARLGALAFTKGSDIHLGPGQDAHLPHEAWHVVQQKEGRVKASAQFRGVAINDEAGLEAEADRMGAAAARQTAPPAAAPNRRVPAGAVVQAKVKAGDAWLKETDPVSATLARFVKDSESFMLRDDFLGRLGVEPLHLLAMSKKYLLGEEHGAAADVKFANETRHWSRVGKMFESNKALPFRDLSDVGLQPSADPQQQDLESVHAFVLLEVMEVLRQIDVLGESWVKSLWKTPGSKRFIAGLFANAKSEVQQIAVSRPFYEAFILPYQKTPATSARSRQVYYFAVRFQDYWRREIRELMVRIIAAEDAVRKFDPSRAAAAATLERVFDRSLAGILAARPFLREMGRALIGLNDITDAKQKKTLERMLTPSAARTGIDVLNAGDIAREEGMKDNIGRAAAPLIVKVGEGHLKNLEAMLTPAVVPIHKNESLEKVTRKP